MPQTTENPNQPLVLDPKNDDSLTAADIVATPQLLEPLIDILEGPDRRARQLSAKLIKEVATLNGELLIPVIKRVIGALHRPEAQTRWEILEALIVLMDLDYKVCARAFDGAEAGLYDEGSKTLRSASFAFFAHLGAKSPAWQERCWPYLDEAIQCYHGDPEFGAMLEALAVFASSKLKQKVKEDLIDRLQFDASIEKGPYRSRAQLVIDCAESKRTYTLKEKLPLSGAQVSKQEQEPSDSTDLPQDKSSSQESSARKKSVRGSGVQSKTSSSKKPSSSAGSKLAAPAKPAASETPQTSKPSKKAVASEKPVKNRKSQEQSEALIADVDVSDESKQNAKPKSTAKTKAVAVSKTTKAPKTAQARKTAASATPTATQKPAKTAKTTEELVQEKSLKEEKRVKATVSGKAAKTSKSAPSAKTAKTAKTAKVATAKKTTASTKSAKSAK